MSYFNMIDQNAYILPLTLLILLISLSVKYHTPISNLIFAIYYPILSKYYHSGVASTKDELFRELHHIKSADITYRNKGLIRILEIGVGPGVNFKYYPPNSRVVVVDPNPYFEKQFRKTCSQYPNVKLEQFVLGRGEDLAEVKDNSMDVVITTAVLCSVKDVRKVLQEIKRVLAPGGKYMFLEHGRGAAGSKYERHQRMIMKIWPYLFNGCQINREYGRKIEETGFSKVNMKRIILSMPFILDILSPNITGIAEK